MRNDFLNSDLFGNMYEAKVLTVRWVRYYNEVRPHSALGGKPVDDIKSNMLMPIIANKIMPDSIVYADSYRSYNALRC